MGRGGYDETDPAAYKSSAAATATQMHEAQRAKEEVAAAKVQAAEDLAKLIKSKRSRGIMDRRRAEKASEEASKNEAGSDRDKMAKPS